jgi:SAM-dependent methyltransferase
MRKGSLQRLMREFWDGKARENAMYYVSSYRAYDDQDPDEFWKWGGILAERFLDESGLQFTGEENVLEIGCGIGRMTAYLARRFRHVHGVDVSLEMVCRAKENLKGFPNVSLHLGNGCDLGGLANGSFDFVFSYITFQHVPDASITSAYVQEAGRVLKEGGHFYFQVNNLPTSIRRRLRLRARCRLLFKRAGMGGPGGAHAAGQGPTEQDHPAWRGSRVSVGQVRRACELGDLEVLRLKGEGTQYLWVLAVKKSDRGVSNGLSKRVV